MRKSALVLSGGGTKGIYQCGAIAALKRLGRDRWDIITGTSVGALNAAMLVQGDFEAMEDMYEHLEADQIVNGYVPKDLSLTGLIKDRRHVLPALGDYLKNEGMDISPFLDMVDRYYAPERFFASDIEFGCVTAARPGYHPVYVTKEMMRENGADWLVASASAYPAFPVKVIGGTEYVDGGYADNSPIDFALRLGAQEVTAIEMHEKVLHPGYLGREHITIVHPQQELYGLLDFDKVKMLRAKTLGYLDTMKAFGILAGIRYSFTPFGLPKGFDPWYLRVMMLEARAGRQAGRWTSDEAVMEALRLGSGRAQLGYVDMFCAALDCLMTAAGLDDTHVWDFRDAREKLREFLAGSDPEAAGNWGGVRAFSGREEAVRYFLKQVKGAEDGSTAGAAGAYLEVRFPFAAALADFWKNVVM